VTDQLALFETSPVEGPDPSVLQLARAHDEARAIARRLPQGVFFGTSSWSFPGWKGIVYSSTRTQTDLAREGLREYAQHPLLTTVGVDRSYYAPMPVEDLRAYSEQLPSGFRCCFKAPASVTAVALGPPARPVGNHDFLSVDRLVDDLLRPCDAAFSDHTGPIILEFPPFPRSMRLEPAEFHARLDRFLAALPASFEYAIELRDARLLTPAYADIIARRRVAHTFNYWSAMPAPGTQTSIVPPDSAGFSVVRLLLRPGTWYEDQRDRFKPFNRIVEPDEAMRADVVAIGRRIVNGGRRVFVLVNNKAEGSSPLTVVALARRLADACAPSPRS
jgi:uncharacterized protein YecE (DUF72 family)